MAAWLPTPVPTSIEPPALSDGGVDLTLIRWMLGLTPSERLQAAQEMVDTAGRLRGGDAGAGGRGMKEAPPDAVWHRTGR